MPGYSTIFKISGNPITGLFGSKDNKLFYEIQQSEHFVIRNDLIRESPENLSVKQALAHLIFGDKINLRSVTRREAYTGALLSICEFFGDGVTSYDRDMYFEPMDYTKLPPTISNELDNIHRLTIEYINTKHPFVEIFENIERIQVTLTGLVQEKNNNESLDNPTLYLVAKEGYHIKLPFIDKKLLRNYQEGQILDCVIVHPSLTGEIKQCVREYDPITDKPMLQLIHFGQKDLIEMTNILKPLHTEDIHKWGNVYADEYYSIWSLTELKKEIEHCLLEGSEVVMFQR